MVHKMSARYDPNEEQNPKQIVLTPTVTNKVSFIRFLCLTINVITVF